MTCSRSASLFVVLVVACSPTYSLSGQLPIFISTKDRDAGKHKGILGITFFANAQVGGDDRGGASIGAAFEVLADSSLFGTALNRLK